MSKVLKFIAEAKKACVAAAGLAAVIVASGQLSGSVEHWAEAFLAIATAVGVYKAENA